MLNTAMMVIVVMGIVGVIFGVILAYANKKFSVEVNPLIHMVEDALPKGQCGACGYAGCQAYAEAVVLDEKVEPNLCVPGKAAVAKIVAELTEKSLGSVDAKVAHLKCSGAKGKCVINYKYEGVQDCTAASLLLGGPKGCQYGCLGLGTCVKSCPFNAMTMGEDGLPKIDIELCTGCGKCKSVCPKKVIEIVDSNIIVSVNCNSSDKGIVAKKLCTVACIGCGICGRNCEHKAIKIENNLAVVDSKICIELCKDKTCFVKCPTGAISKYINHGNATKEVSSAIEEVAAMKK